MTATSAPSPRLGHGAATLRKGVFAALEERIAEVRSRGIELVPFHIGDTHRTPPLAAREALVAPRAETYRYGPTAGLGKLREALAAFVNEQRYKSASAHTPTTSAEILVGAGGTHALHCVSRVLLDPGDEVIVLSPYWPLAPGIFEAQGARCVEVVVDLGARALSGDALRAKLQAAVTARTRAVYFVSPGNPDGAVFRHEHLEAILAIAVASDLWVLADEVYADTTYDVAHVPFRAAFGGSEAESARARSVSLYSFSKSFALAGQRVGFAVAPPAVVAAALRISTHTVFNVPLASQQAAAAALEAPGSFLAETRAAYRLTRDAVATALAEAGVPAPLPDAGVYFFLELAEILGGRPLDDLLLACVDEGVLLAPGPAFGEAFGTRARLCFTSVDHATTLVGIERLGRAVARFRAS